MEINFKQTLFSIDSRNRKCNDCGDEGVKYVSVNNGITLCELCAEIHRNFGNQISYLRSIDDEFDDYLMAFFIYGGNKKFRKTLKQLGVNLDQKKGHLYRTYGADFYRRNLKSISKGNSHLDKDFDNPNEIMKDDSHSFPEFENYVLNQNNNIYSNQNNPVNMNELNNLNLNIDLNYNDNFGVNVINNPLDNDLNNPEINNNKEIQINPKEKKINSVENKPEPPPAEDKKSGIENNSNTTNKVQVNDEDEDSADRRIKKIVDLSVKGVKKLGHLMKVGGIKGYEVAKKYGKATVKVTKNYVKEKMANYKNKNATNDAKEDDNNN